ncbi:hypothetical protein Roomu2_00105 [Pseudomonas phage vB_PpuM-Roomu-2]|uniref:Uncharacterized protein n=3 Tax=Tartuvirus TaxID=3424912 RepID=A0AAX4MX31_9CAUD
MQFDEKPTDVSHLEWRVARFVQRCAEFLALCAAMMALQAFLTIFNPANPVDRQMTNLEDGGLKKRLYLSCVSKSQSLYGFEWNLAIRDCERQYKEAARHWDYP